MTDHASPAEVNGYVAEITDAFQAAATQINTNKSSNKLNQDNNHKPWFGKECKTARRNYHLAKRIHHNIKSDENRANLLEASKHYKKTMNKFINKYTKSKCNKLRHMSTHEPKSYWKFLNSLNKKKHTEPPPVKAVRCGVLKTAKYSNVSIINFSVLFSEYAKAHRYICYTQN